MFLMNQKKMKIYKNKLVIIMTMMTILIMLIKFIYILFMYYFLVVMLFNFLKHVVKCHKYVLMNDLNLFIFLYKKNINSNHHYKNYNNFSVKF